MGFNNLIHTVFAVLCVINEIESACSPITYLDPKKREIYENEVLCLQSTEGKLKLTLLAQHMLCQKDLNLTPASALLSFIDTAPSLSLGKQVNISFFKKFFLITA